jgi:hypothetical protein
VKGQRQNPFPWKSLAAAVVAGAGSGVGYEIAARATRLYDQKRLSAKYEKGGKNIAMTSKLAQEAQKKGKKNPERWAQEATEEMEEEGTVGSLTRIAKGRGYTSPLGFARAVMKRWRAGKRTVYNRKTKRQSRITQDLMYKALFAVNMNKGRRVKKNPKLIVVNPGKKSPLQAKAEKALGHALSRAEKRALDKAVREYREFHGSDPTGGRRVRVSPGTPSILVGIGEATETNYHVPFSGSDRKGAWTHRAGDHGRTQKKTKAPFLAWIPGSKGPPVFAQGSGSDLRFKPSHGIVG